MTKPTDSGDHDEGIELRREVLEHSRRWIAVMLRSVRPSKRSLRPQSCSSGTTSGPPSRRASNPRARPKWLSENERGLALVESEHLALRGSESCATRPNWTGTPVFRMPLAVSMRCSAVANSAGAHATGRCC